MSIGEIATIVAGIAGGLSAIIAAVALVGIQRQTEAALFVTINDEWSKIYFTYREVLLADVPMEDLEKLGDADLFINSEPYRKLHTVFSFYEFLGSCVSSKLVSPTLLFKLVSVNPKLWLKYKPLIERMREMGASADFCIEWQRLTELRMRTVV
ncbi:MAG: hypothetical protein NT015_17665 [Alphaproteobacteria bacterium]|nr:hypothetical protein [Alphaproteobacteria bacterium]